MRHQRLFLAIALCVALASADAITREKLAQYAASLKGLKKADLKTAIHKLCQPTTILGYGSGEGKTWSGFYKSDRIAATNECVNRYSTDKFYFTGGNTSKAISGMNIEHSFPKSWWGGSENNAYKDLYNLYPSESSANSAKSNYVMGEVTNASKLDDYEKVGTGALGSKVYVVEPNDTWKGDFCRSYFYMVTTYQNLTWTSQGLNCLENNTWPTLKQWAYELYLKWCANDRVDSIEVARNNAVADIQGNRNLYVDFPFLGDYVWGDSTDVAFDPATAITTASDDDRYGQYQPTPDTPDTPDGSYTFAKTTAQPTAGKRYLIVADNGGELLAMKTMSSGKSYGYLDAETVTATDDKITLSADTYAFTLEDAGSGYHIKGSDGKYYYNESAYKTFSASASEPSGAWTVTSRGDGTYTIAYGSHFIQYSTTYSSYGAYASAQSKAVYPCLYEEQDNATTGIGSVAPTAADDAGKAVYNMQGMRLGTSQPLRPGIYIRGGKKFVVR